MKCYILEKEESAIATIVIRGSTDNIIDDIERAIDDGINVFKALTKVGNHIGDVMISVLALIAIDCRFDPCSG